MGLIPGIVRTVDFRRSGLWGFKSDPDLGTVTLRDSPTILTSHAPRSAKCVLCCCSTTAPVQHKLLRLHQIRYGVTLCPYDLTWNLLAVIMIIVGAVLMRGRAGVARSGIFRSGPAPAAE
jgi:hypothetical protein